MKSLKDNGTSLQVVQKLLVNSVATRDFSAQETCHLLLQLPMFRASRDFVILSLDDSREVSDQLGEDTAVTLDSQLDHYCGRPTTPEFESLSLLQFVQQYRIPKRVGENLLRRRKDVIVICRPYCSPDPSGPKYEQYCRQKLMMHQPFRRREELLGESDSHAEAYSIFLRSGAPPPSLADDISRLEAMQRENRETNAEEVSLYYTTTSMPCLLNSLCTCRTRRLTRGMKIHLETCWNGCLYASTELSFLTLLGVTPVLTGHLQPVSILIWRRCRISLLSSASTMCHSQLVQQLIPTDCRESSWKPTRSCSSTLQTRHLTSSRSE